jgi:hypothetical protein
LNQCKLSKFGDDKKKSQKKRSTDSAIKNLETWFIENIMRLGMRLVWRLGGWQFKASLDKKVSKTPSQSISQVCWYLPVIPDALKSASRKITV